MTVSPSFGELLRHYRHRAGFTQTELTERSDLSIYSISNVERDLPHVPRRDTIRRLCAALHLSVPDQMTLIVSQPSLSSALLKPVATSYFPRLRGHEQESAALHTQLCNIAATLIMLCDPDGIEKLHQALHIVHLIALQNAEEVVLLDDSALPRSDLMINAILQTHLFLLNTMMLHDAFGNRLGT
jgi:transcriptional regulator with XRE-family HTH domain